MNTSGVQIHRRKYTRKMNEQISEGKDKMNIIDHLKIQHSKKGSLKLLLNYIYQKKKKS